MPNKTRQRPALPLPRVGIEYGVKPGPGRLATTCKVSWIDDDGIHGQYFRADGTDGGSFYNYSPQDFWVMAEPRGAR